MSRPFASRTGIDARAEVAGEIPELADAKATTVIRVLQEAMRNAEKHARTASIRITLEVRGAEIMLRVADSGIGFSPAATAHQGLGLDSMQERAQLVQGKLTVNSHPGKGTAVVIRVPWQPQAS